MLRSRGIRRRASMIESSEWQRCDNASFHIAGCLKCAEEGAGVSCRRVVLFALVAVTPLLLESLLQQLFRRGSRADGSLLWGRSAIGLHLRCTVRARNYAAQLHRARVGRNRRMPLQRRSNGGEEGEIARQRGGRLQECNKISQRVSERTQVGCSQKTLLAADRERVLEQRQIGNTCALEHTSLHTKIRRKA